MLSSPPAASLRELRSQESPIKAPAFLLAALSLQSAFAAQPPVDRQDVLVPSEANYICKGDFNNDGITDLAVNNGETSGISILLGNGDGTFRQPPIQASTDAYPDAIAAADFNGDHNLDLIVLPLTGDFGSFELLLGNGDGTFQPPREIAFPNSGTVWYVLTPDLNHDGAPDLVFAADGRDEVIVLLGNGDGTFQSAEILHMGGNVALGDFNNDGNLDIAASFALYSPYFKVALGNGDGTFQPPIVNEFPGAPLASADLNGDGLDDLILNFNGTALLAALSKGDGTFRKPVEVPYEASGGALIFIPTVGDVDGDGKPDLLVVGQSDYLQAVECCALSVLHGNGDGTFGDQRDYQVGSFGSLEISPAVILADFNGDGHADVAVPGGIFAGVEVTSGTVSVLLGNGKAGLFYAPPHFSYGSMGAGSATLASVAAGKLIGSPNSDVAVINNVANQVVVFPGLGNGVLGNPQAFAVGASPVGIVLVDANHDGKLDLVTANAGSNDISVLLSSGNGNFGPAVSVPCGVGPSAIVTGDFNNDGTPDLAVSNTSSGSLTILLGTGAGSFSAASNPLVSSPGAMATGDFNRDGNLDLAIASVAGSFVSILLGDGKGGFTNAATIPTPLPAVSIAAGDFNGDGVPDLAITVAQQVENSSGFVSELITVMGRGNGTFASGILSVLPNGPAAIVVADVNGDGHLDLVTANAGNNDVSALLGDGLGHFAIPLSLGADYSAYALAVADFNGDGRPDLVVSNPFDNRVTVMTNIRGVK